MDVDDDDPVVNVLPIHYSDALAPNIHIHQYPLLNRPLQVPPSAELSGKRIRARIKPNVKRLEVHVPADTRPGFWNSDKGKVLGAARIDDDREKNQESKGKQREGEEPRLGEVRMRSEQIEHKGAYMLGIVRDGKLHLHPVSETHQMRPTLTYLDALSRKTRRRPGGGSDSDSDDGPPPDPDEPAPAPPPPKKEKKPAGEAKEVQVSARKTSDDKTAQPLQGGLSSVRREMLQAIKTEEEEAWDDLEFCGGETVEAEGAFESIFSRSAKPLECKTEVTAFLNRITEP